MQNHSTKQELKALKQELGEWKTKQQDDFTPPELEPEQIKPMDFQSNDNIVEIPGIFIDPRVKVKNGNR